LPRIAQFVLVLLLLMVGLCTGLASVANLAVPAKYKVRNSNANNGVEEPTAFAILEVLKAQQAAWNRGDIPLFLEGYWKSPDLTFAGSDGIVRGYDGVLARYRKSYPDRAAMGKLEFSSLETRVLARDAALVLGHWHLKRPSGDVGGVFTLVFRRFSTGWRIIHDHTSAQMQTP
jgi:ketosteroid isomerase-like protein